MWGKILQAVMTMAGAAKLNFMPVIQWFLTHGQNVQNAIDDLKKGADWTTVITDLFKQIQGFAQSKRGTKMACDHETCCKNFCAGVGNALIEYHSGNQNAVNNAMAHLADAFVALSAESGVTDDPCDPCSDDQLNQCKQVAGKP